MVCDTCGSKTEKVYRVVVDTGYDRSSSVAVYNCAECFERKRQQRAAEQPSAQRENDQA
jgi:uncharacterized Zn finger protein